MQSCVQESPSGTWRGAGSGWGLAWDGLGIGSAGRRRGFRGQGLHIKFTARFGSHLSPRGPAPTLLLSAGRLPTHFKVSSRWDSAVRPRLRGAPTTLTGPSLWCRVLPCALAPVSPPCRFFPGSLRVHIVSCPCLGPGGYARAPSACWGPCILSPNSRPRPPPCGRALPTLGTRERPPAALRLCPGWGSYF